MKLQYWHVYFWTVSTWSCLLLTLWPELWVWKRFVLVIGWLVPYPAVIWPLCCWPGSKIFINNQSPGCLAVAEDYLSVWYRFAYVCWRNVLFFILPFLQAGRGDSLSRLFVFSLKTFYRTACVRWIFVVVVLVCFLSMVACVLVKTLLCVCGWKLCVLCWSCVFCRWLSVIVERWLCIPVLFKVLSYFLSFMSYLKSFHIGNHTLIFRLSW